MGSTVNYVSLFATIADGASGGSSASSLLGIIDGAATASKTSSPSQALAALNSAEANQTRDVATVAAEPAVARDIAAFKQAVATATSPAQLLSNPTALSVILTANGLGDQTSYTALAQKALLSDPSNSSSLANQLSSTNSAWLSAAQTYDFATKGLSVIQNPSVVSTIASAYAEVTWRNSLDSTTPGLSDALTFRSEASGITSVDQILGDPILRSVVTTTLGLPESIALQPLEAQEKAISSRLDISKFQNASFTESFVQRYLITMATQSSSSSSGTSSLYA